MANFELSSFKDKSSAAQIVGFKGPSETIERLQELGLHIGLEVYYFGQAPLGGPLLYRLNSTIIALRKEEAQCLLCNNKN